jgi:hypothetical protein
LLGGIPKEQSSTDRLRIPLSGSMITCMSISILPYKKLKQSMLTCLSPRKKTFEISVDKHFKNGTEMAFMKGKANRNTSKLQNLGQQQTRKLQSYTGY